MGCCECCQRDASVIPSSLATLNHIILFEDILSKMPAGCRQQLRDLSVQRFFAYYKLHLDAAYYALQKEYLLAIFSELIAIEEFKLMLPEHQDHFVFFNMYAVLSVCFFEIGNFERAAEATEAMLAITLKYMPTDYREISGHYFQLAKLYLILQQWQKTEHCILKTIETRKIINDVPQFFFQALEQCLIIVRRNMADGANSNPIKHYFSPNPGESTDNFLHRVTTAMMPIYNEIGLLEIDKTEYERLPDKQTESQITDEILNELLQNLEKYLKEDTFLRQFGRQGAVASFIAAYFKATQMKTSSLSPVMIEAALTIIINRIDEERFTSVKQSPMKISYTDNHVSQMKGVRVFNVTAK